LQFQLNKRPEHSLQIDPTLTELGDKILASALWGSPGDRRVERFMVFTIRDGKIIDMQGFTSQRAAQRFATS
jgi:hypothetical protein